MLGVDEHRPLPPFLAEAVVLDRETLATALIKTFTIKIAERGSESATKPSDNKDKGVGKSVEDKENPKKED